MGRAGGGGHTTKTAMRTRRWLGGDDRGRVLAPLGVGDGAESGGGRGHAAERADVTGDKLDSRMGVEVDGHAAHELEGLAGVELEREVAQDVGDDHTLLHQGELEPDALTRTPTKREVGVRFSARYFKIFSI